MADWPDDPPLFVMVMGCSGCGKSSWKRYHRDDLPPDYLDLDSIAEGLGSWDSEAAGRKHGTSPAHRWQA